MKKIAIDLDGVIFDSETLYRVYTEIYDAEVNKKDTLVNNSPRMFQKRYTWTDEEFISFYNQYSEEILKNANLMTGVEVVLNKLKEKYDLVIVTSRNDEETNIAKDKLATIGLSDINIYNNERHKIERFLSEGVDYIIDDDEEICLNAASSNIKTFFLKNGASNKLNHPNIINVNNWGEIYKYLFLNDNN